MENTKEQSIRELFETIKDIKICMLTTIDSNGKLNSRPMGTIKSEEEKTDIYFFTNHYSYKVDEVKNNQEVNLGYVDLDKDLFVSVSGVASISKDEAKIRQLWNPLYKVWFPKGIDDPNLVLLKIEPINAEYWDSPSNKMIQFFGFAKALITGKEYKEGEHHKLSIQK